MLRFVQAILSDLKSFQLKLIIFRMIVCCTGKYMVFHVPIRRSWRTRSTESPFNSLAPGRPGCHFKTAIFNIVLLNVFSRSSNDNAPRWMRWDLTDDKSTLVQVMARCRQATSHYMNNLWPRSFAPYGVNRPQWVNLRNTQQSANRVSIA